MDPELKRKVEVETLAGLLDELDYYRILKLKAGSPIGEVEKAFASQSKTFHPDRFFGVRDPKFTKKVTAVYKKVTEAYQVLKDPELKKMYDQKLGVRGGGPSASGSGAFATSTGSFSAIDKNALEKERDQLASGEIVSDKRAKKYWELAQIANQNEDWNGVVMNLQFAISFEPDNVLLKQRLDDAKVKMEEKKKKGVNPYKIKIV